MDVCRQRVNVWYQKDGALWLLSYGFLWFWCLLRWPALSRAVDLGCGVFLRMVGAALMLQTTQTPLGEHPSGTHIGGPPCRIYHVASPLGDHQYGTPLLGPLLWGTPWGRSLVNPSVGDPLWVNHIGGLPSGHTLGNYVEGPPLWEPIWRTSPGEPPYGTSLGWPPMRNPPWRTRCRDSLMWPLCLTTILDHA
jgi:hypothetical protein